MSTITCPSCGSKRTWRDGTRRTRNGDVQRYICRECGYRFSERPEIPPGSNPGRDFSYMKPNRHGFNRRSGLSNRQICASDTKEAKNLAGVEIYPLENLAEPQKLSLLRKCPAPQNIFKFAFWLKKNGYAESTIIGRVKLLKIMVRRGANLYDPESIKEVIANQKWSQGRKSNAVDAYSSFLQMAGGKWDPPRYARLRRLPFIPLESEVDQLIAGSNRRMAAFCQLIKETGARPGEAHKLKWIDIDPNSNTICINEPEKKSNPRLIKVSPKLIAMLNMLPKKTEYVFATVKLKTLQRSFQRQRNQIAIKLQNPRLKNINFIILRHFKGTMEYHKTKDILHVMTVLGHKNIKNTLVYTHLVKFADKDEYTSKVAHSVEEACELVDKGFEYVGCINGAEIFRTRK
jgi:integrase